MTTALGAPPRRAMPGFFLSTHPRVDALVPCTQDSGWCLHDIVNSIKTVSIGACCLTFSNDSFHNPQSQIEHPCVKRTQLCSQHHINSFLTLRTLQLVRTEGRHHVASSELACGAGFLMSARSCSFSSAPIVRTLKYMQISPPALPDSLPKC